jgi:glycosyltransferase EpsE
MDTPKVSVIMGIYNCEKTLSAAIESVLEQTYTNWELIMCDDGSNDRTYEIAESYRDKLPDKIILLRNAVNQRLAATLNNCLRVASGEYVARMDADDINLPQRFEKQVKFLNEHNDITCVGTGMLIFDENGNRSIRLGNEYPSRMCLIHATPFAHPTIMMRKKAYDVLGGYTSDSSTMRAEDVDLWFRFFEKGYAGYVIQEPLYRYRESLSDFKKRTLKAAIGTTRVCLRGYRKLKYPFYLYPYAFKPIIVTLIPNKMMYSYHLHKDNRAK